MIKIVKNGIFSWFIIIWISFKEENKKNGKNRILGGVIGIS